MTEKTTAEDEGKGAIPSRYIDQPTTNLSRVGRSFDDWQKLRKAEEGRARSHLFGSEKLTPEQEAIVRQQPRVQDALRIERKAARELSALLQEHPLWPWLDSLKGLGGSRTAQVVAAIGDPRRFPGQRCTEGHTFPPGCFQVGERCPLEVKVDDSRPSVGEDVVSVQSDGEGAGAVDEGESESPDGSRSFTDVDAVSAARPGDGAGADEPLVDAADDGSRSVAEPPYKDDTGIGDGAGADVTSESDAEGSSRSVTTERCSGIMLPPRTTTGVRSVWHYFGLYPDANGRLVRRRKGEQASFSPRYRSLLLGPFGTADQIVRHYTPAYRPLYDSAKQTKLDQGLPPWRANYIGRVVVVKAFVGDLLIHWKELV